MDAQYLGVLVAGIDEAGRHGDTRRRIPVVDRLAQRHVADVARSDGDPAGVGEETVLARLAGEDQRRGRGEEEADTAAHHRPARAVRRPGEAEAGRDVVGVVRDVAPKEVLATLRVAGAGEAQAVVERQIGPRPEAVLAVEPPELPGRVEVGEGHVAEEDLGDGGVVGEEVREGLEVVHPVAAAGEQVA